MMVSNSPAASEAGSVRLPPIWVMFFVIVLVQFVCTIGLATIYTMITTLHREYAGQGLDIGWSITAYLFVAAAGTTFCGRLGDIYQRRNVILAMLFIAALGALISMAWTTAFGLILGCALQGIAGALAPVVASLAHDYMPARRVPMAIGAITAAGTGGSGIAFYLAGWFTDHYASQGAFGMKLFFAVFAILVVWVAVPLLPGKQKVEDGQRTNFLRGALFLPPLAALLIATNRFLAWGPGDPRTLALTAAGIAGLVLWARQQHREANPIMDFGLLRDRRLLCAVLAHFLLGLGAIQSAQVLSYVIQEPVWTGIGLGLTAAAAGLMLGAIHLSTAFAAVGSGKMVERYGARLTAIMGALITLIGWISLLLWHDDYISMAIAGLIIINGVAIVITGDFALWVQYSPRGRTGETTSMGYVGCMVAMAFGSQIIIGLFASSTVADPDIAGLRHADPAAFTRVLWYAVAFSVALLVTLILLPKRDGREKASA